MWTLCSHRTIQYLFSVRMELGTARCLNFCMFKVVLCEHYTSLFIAQFFNCLIICLVLCERSGRPNVRKKVKENDHTFYKISALREGCKGYI